MNLPKYMLFFLAGLLWSTAGAMVLSLGIPALLSSRSWYLVFAALCIFYLFYRFVFSRLLRKHERRIARDERLRMPWWAFFDRQSYLIMAFMMTGGMILRFSAVLPPYFLAFFYSGLGTSLLSCGLRFVQLALAYRLKFT